MATAWILGHEVLKAIFNCFRVHHGISFCKDAEPRVTKGLEALLLLAQTNENEHHGMGARTLPWLVKAAGSNR